MYSSNLAIFLYVILFFLFHVYVNSYFLWIKIVLYIHVHTDYPGKLRLVNGTNTYSFAGRLEIYHNGRWNSICSYGFGYDDVVLACKQLGYRTYQRYGTVGRLG